MTDHSLAVQGALFGVLETPAITGVQAVRDVPKSVPHESDFPFIQIGDSQITPDDADKSSAGSDDGVIEYVDLHIWSRYRGQKEAKEIAAEIYSRLHDQSLSVAGRASCLVWVRDRRVFTDTDGLTRHGIVTLEIIHRS